MKELSDVFWGVVFWTLICIFVFGFNPWSKLVDWIQLVRGKPPIFSKSRIAVVEIDKRRKGRLSTGKVYVATAIRDGDVVQDNVIAKDDTAARRLAAESLRVDVEDVEVEEIVERVVRR